MCMPLCFNVEYCITSIYVLLVTRIEPKNILYLKVLRKLESLIKKIKLLLTKQEYNYLRNVKTKRHTKIILKDISIKCYLWWEVCEYMY